MRISFTALIAFLGLFSLCAGAAAPVLSDVVSPELSTTYLCKARSLTGKYYSATGTNKILTQDAAMKACSAQSFRCYPTGCIVTGK